MKTGIDFTTILIAIAGYYVVIKPKYQKTEFNSKPPNTSKKFPGYQITNQMIYVTNPKKLKEYAFSTGLKEPEGNLFKLIFGSNEVSYSDVKKDDWAGHNITLIVKDKVQQDTVYVLLSYLFAGAYQQSPHRVGHYADIINKYVVYLKNMFNVDYPILKSTDQAEKLFKELATTL